MARWITQPNGQFITVREREGKRCREREKERRNEKWGEWRKQREREGEGHRSATIGWKAWGKIRRTTKEEQS